ncbi:MAG: peroxiredoxin (alkyl hydroperoxide reductase subunit C) [Parcubacteria group bacterium Gr01-1014_48]|nr:MAG: peroxiredoxin (alkyl hydroperoxide reductase subunit C) [Parcubacteria group bacterium Greene0416_14]TSC74552.1 MAG: peroxiredoxin (alkyl hydroperoxide reductase subunit C) [Parcubacteria group bacterium Gr01-1014_48]TSD01428.1 MAG: peroxiredoxin (alkyl hydroperoxide reductase subunit C) [Parcubacteria group bacterium Greene1014_15]TSD08430.1 MAG: peroxiredoxin (alkyl hydroperoxide reductase subunit C) [Parcubacteria group bacterium Greene0714_4]
MVVALHIENISMNTQSTGACNDHEIRATLGKPIPDFEFEAFHNEEIKHMSLASYKSKWLVLFFYPADFTFICPTELEELAFHYAEFQKLNTEVLSISTDTVWVHKAWHDQSPAIKKISFPMVADPSGKITKAFGTYIENSATGIVEDEGLSVRGTFIIDPKGILRVIELHSNNIGRSAQELLRKLQAAKFVYEHGGLVCPASWKPGDDTLEPGLSLVGKL